MNKKLLVVDDDSGIRRLIVRAVQADGYQVSEESDGDRAIGRARAEKPAVIIMDLRMPRLDGIAALSEILEAAPHTRVLVITGDPSLAKLATERGAAGFLTKPLDFEALRACVADLFQASARG